MKQYAYFLFDFDGTLLDSNEHVITCFQEAFRKVLNIELPREEITPTFGIPLAEALQAMAPLHADELLHVYRACSDAHGMQLMRAINGARETLRALHAAGAVNAIVTSKKEVNARRQMAHIGIEGDIDLLVGPEQTSAHKPDPAPVLRAMELLGAEPADCLMIGDSPHDILCGKNAHVDTAGVSFTAVALESLLAAGPTHMIDQLSMLVPMARAARL